MKEKGKIRWKTLALTSVLGLSLLASGCGGTEAESTVAESLPASSAADSAPAEEETTTDYTKYNSYVELLSEIYTAEDALYAYFNVVANQPEFALNEGMDYSMLEDSFAYVNLSTSAMSTAIHYKDSEPAYPEADALLEKLEQPYQDLVAALNELADYMSFVNYQDDNMAQAAQIHQHIYSAVTEYDQYVWDFIDQINILDENTEADELNRLKDEGFDIAYHSRVIANTCLSMEEEIWAQLDQSDSLPVLDMTNLETLYAQYQEASSALNAALNDPEQVQKVRSWEEEGDYKDMTLKMYQGALSSLDTTLTALMETARSQGDYTEAYNQFDSAVSEFIDEYNNRIAG